MQTYIHITTSYKILESGKNDLKILAGIIGLNKFLIEILISCISKSVEKCHFARITGLCTRAVHLKISLT